MQSYRYKKKITLELPVDNRWGTTHKLFHRIISSLEAILLVLDDRRIKEKASLEKDAKPLRQFITNSNNVAKMKDIESVLRPLSQTIKIVEGDKIEPANAYVQVLEAFEQAVLNTGIIQSLSSDIKEEIIQVIVLFLKWKMSKSLFLNWILDSR